jgi:HEAT repeat protein
MRRTAVESIGKIGDPQTVDSILPLSHDPAALVRGASVLAMGRLKPTATREVAILLTQALEDPSNRSDRPQLWQSARSNQVLDCCSLS